MKCPSNYCHWFALIAIATLFTANVFGAEQPTLKFSKRCLMVNLNEGCAIADVNNDGRPDVIAGTHWYANPDFVPRPLRDIPEFGGDYLSSNGDHPLDVDGDGWIDVVSVGWMDKEICWFRNPGADELHKGRRWEQHVLASGGVANEAIDLRDLDGDGRPEIIVSCWEKKSPLVGYRIVKNTEKQPTIEPFVIGAEGGGHGYAFGDLNGDGLEDVLCEIGWYEHPQGDIFAQPWKLHRETALPHPSCPFIVAKLTDSGRSDLIWGKGHDYGLFWWEQGQPMPDGTTTWTEHLIDDSWSQPHCLAWADIDGDDQPELITGKRSRAHIDGDPGGKEPECLYYYKWDSTARKFTRHTIAGPGEGIGGGMQIRIGDLNGDNRPDIVVAGKTGTWILLNEGF